MHTRSSCCCCCGGPILRIPIGFLHSFLRSFIRSFERLLHVIDLTVRTIAGGAFCTNDGPDEQAHGNGEKHPFPKGLRLDHIALSLVQSNGGISANHTQFHVGAALFSAQIFGPLHEGRSDSHAPGVWIDRQHVDVAFAGLDFVNIAGHALQETLAISDDALVGDGGHGSDRLFGGTLSIFLSDFRCRIRARRNATQNVFRVEKGPSHSDHIRKMPVLVQFDGDIAFTGRHGGTEYCFCRIE